MGGKLHWPRHGSAGIALIVTFWTLNWSVSGLHTHWMFFPLWLGYCLTVDGLTVLLKGDSLLTRSRKAYVSLFVISMPSWWLFEAINLRTRNWHYVGSEFFSPVAYAAWTSLSFATVLPAVFGTAELVASLWLTERIKRRSGPALSKRMLFGMFALGCGMLALVLALPTYFFPFVWLSVFCVIDPINAWRGYGSLLRAAVARDWRVITSLSLGCVVCGVFWEMWNFYSYPKWIYAIPFVDFWRVFEMPILGYLGYIPFGWELFALYCLLTGLLGGRDRQRYINWQ